jgi:hypothetical protein
MRARTSRGDPPASHCLQAVEDGSVTPDGGAEPGVDSSDEPGVGDTVLGDTVFGDTVAGGMAAGGALVGDARVGEAVLDEAEVGDRGGGGAGSFGARELWRFAVLEFSTWARTPSV